MLGAVILGEPSVAEGEYRPAKFVFDNSSSTVDTPGLSAKTGKERMSNAFACVVQLVARSFASVSTSGAPRSHSSSRLLVSSINRRNRRTTLAATAGVSKNKELPEGIRIGEEVDSKSIAG